MTAKSRRLRWAAISVAAVVALMLSPWAFRFSTVRCFYPERLQWIAAGLTVLSIVCALLVTFGLARKATIYLLVSALIFAPLGVAFLMLGSEVLFCSFPSQRQKLFWLLTISVLGLGLLVYFRHLRPRTKELIRINPKAFDFANMQLHASGPFIRSDRKEPITATFFISCGFLGILAAQLIPNGPIEDAFTVLVGWLLGYVFIGYVLVANCYQAWLIHQKERALGGKMTVHEFAPRAQQGVPADGPRPEGSARH